MNALLSLISLTSIIGHISAEGPYFDEYCAVMSHNAFNYLGHSIIVPNQPYSISSQLNNGIKAFMFDNHKRNDEIVMCHGSLCGWDGVTKFVDVMKNDIIPYLQRYQDKIISIIIEDDVDDRELYQSSLNEINNIELYMFNPFDERWNPNSPHWPSINNMIQYNQRLLIYTSSSSNSGYYSVHGGSDNIYIMYQWDFTVENYWSMGATIFDHDYSCYSRSESDNLDATTIQDKDFNWIPLFVLNHFHGVPEMSHSGIDNEYTHLMNRYIKYCYPASNKLPNYLAIDWINKGDPKEFIDVINNGGIILYEGDNASQDIVCGIDTSFSHGINMQSNSIGCENDEARSVMLTDVKAGTLITLYDSPSKSKKDDYAIIYVKENIGEFIYRNSYTINSFERDINDNKISMNYFRNNGLNGKLSYVEIQLNGNPFGNPQIVFYEAINIGQNLLCTLPISVNAFINFKSDSYGCDNDEAKSLIITSAKKSTVITLYDSPDGRTSDDYYVITVLNDFYTKQNVNSFELSFRNSYISGYFHRHNGLNGKVSSVRIDTSRTGSNALFIPELSNKNDNNNYNKYHHYYYININIILILLFFMLLYAVTCLCYKNFKLLSKKNSNDSEFSDTDV